MLPVLIIGGIYVKKVRVYELAKELEISSKELMERMKELGLEVSSHMSTLEKEDAKLVTSLINDQAEENQEITDNIKEEKNLDNEKEKLEDRFLCNEYVAYR